MAHIIVRQQSSVPFRENLQRVTLRFVLYGKLYQEGAQYGTVGDVTVPP